MKKSVFLSIGLAFMAITYTAAQDLDEILKNHYKAVGQEKLVKYKSMQASGKAMVQGMEMPIKIASKRPDKIRIVVEVQGSEIVSAYDGETTWSINPMTGSADPVEVTGPEADGLIESADMDGQLWNYKEKGHQMELEGSEEWEGTEVYVLKLTKKNGNIDHYYLDVDSYLIVRVKSITIMNGSEVESGVLLSNYQEVEGTLIPFSTEQIYGGQTTMTLLLEEISYDVELEDAIFSKPAGN